MYTINQVRANGYWILGMRHVVSSVLRPCVKCRRLRGKPVGQMMGDLPSERLEPSPPFTYCGIDCFGPFHVTDGRKTSKRYGLLVTCLSSRAVHLEALDDMTTDSFINGLRCVIAVRGKVNLIWCDRGTNFVGASNEFKAAWKGLEPERVASEMLSKGCEFRFNPPSASHMGGVWERQIRTVRSVLSGLLLKYGQSLTSSSLRTLLYEVMAIVNSRPLSVESLESPNCPRPLTPNHILTMKSDPILPPPGVFAETALYVRQRWRRVQFLAEEFWRLWRREYLASLQSRRVWKHPQKNVEVGDVMLVHDENASRPLWKVGRVEQVFPGKDDLVRKVRLRMSEPTQDDRGRAVSGSRALERPVHKLTLLWSANDPTDNDPSHSVALNE